MIDNKFNLSFFLFQQKIETNLVSYFWSLFGIMYIIILFLR